MPLRRLTGQWAEPYPTSSDYLGGLGISTYQIKESDSGAEVTYTILFFYTTDQVKTSSPRSSYFKVKRDNGTWKISQFSYI
jgi:hypothetical protein